MSECVAIVFDYCVATNQFEDKPNVWNATRPFDIHAIYISGNRCDTKQLTVNVLEKWR